MALQIFLSYRNSRYYTVFSIYCNINFIILHVADSKVIRRIDPTIYFMSQTFNSYEPQPFRFYWKSYRSRHYTKLLMPFPGRNCL